MNFFNKNISGFALVNVIIGLVIVSMGILIVTNFNSFMSKEEVINNKEFDFYLGLNNLIEKTYNKDWDELELGPQELALANSKSIKFEYILDDQVTQYGTQKLQIKFLDYDNFNYSLEKIK